jgi:hypothetical protein
MDAPGALRGRTALCEGSTFPLPILYLSFKDPNTLLPMSMYLAGKKGKFMESKEEGVHDVKTLILTYVHVLGCEEGEVPGV